MTPSEREETTEYAIKSIDSLLAGNYYAAALLLASTYSHIRLRTLLTDYISPPKDKWKETHSILSRLPFYKLLAHCEKNGKLEQTDPTKLKNLQDKRNKVAHETELWKELNQTEIGEIKQKCEFVKDFLKKTN